MPKEVALSLAIPTGQYVVGCNYANAGPCIGQPDPSVLTLRGIAFRVASPVRLTRAEFKLVLGTAWGNPHPAKASIQFSAWLYATKDGQPFPDDYMDGSNTLQVASAAPPSAKLAARDISADRAQPSTVVSIALDDPAQDPQDRWLLRPGTWYALAIASDDTVACSVVVPFATLDDPRRPARGCAYPTVDYCRAPLKDCGGAVARYDDDTWRRDGSRVPHMDVWGIPAA